MGTIFDLHLHTIKYSLCSELSPVAAAKRAMKLKLDGIAITEHDARWEEGEIAELLEQAKARNLRILTGQELSCYREGGVSQGHLLAFGVNRKIESTLPIEEVIDMVHEEGGVVLAAHPYREEFGLGDDVYRLDLDGIEVLSPHHLTIDTMKAERAWKELSIAGIGGSDAHRRGDIGKFLTYFEDGIKDEADLVNAIKARRCRPVNYQEAMKLRESP